MSMCAIYRTIAHFNPRPRDEGDATKGYVLPADEISIHALVKRATVSAHRRMRLHSISIHALVKRATANLYNDYLYFEAKYHISDIFHQ